MKRVLALICMILVIAGLMVIAGCSSGGFEDVNLDEPIAKGTQSNFIDEDGDLIAFTQFGTFKLIVNDQLVEGNYGINNTEDGDLMELTFEDGKVETWSIVVTEGKVTALIDEDGTQYTQQDQLELERQDDN